MCSDKKKKEKQACTHRPRNLGKEMKGVFKMTQLLSSCSPKLSLYLHKPITHASYKPPTKAHSY